MRSVCARSLLRSILSSLQLRTISAAAFAGMMPSRAWTRARAASMSRYLRVRFSSDHTWRMASVLKRLPKMAESTMVADRKSTRLNSSHLVISYAVFCLKKKKDDGDVNQHVDAHHVGVTASD